MTETVQLRPDIEADARAYARHRLEREAAEAEAEAAVAPLRAKVDEAMKALGEALEAHPATARAKHAAAQEESARAGLIRAWPLVVDNGHPQTVPVPGGKVQLRVARGVEVRDAAQLAAYLLKAGLFKAAVKEVKVVEKIVLPLVHAGADAGTVAKETYSIAWLADKGA